MRNSSDKQGLLRTRLQDVPNELIPSDPRCGGSCLPVKAERLKALTSSGPVLLGRSASTRDFLSFQESVISELRSLLRLREDQSCSLVTGPPESVYRSLAIEDWGSDLEVRSVGRASTAWREALALRPRSGLGLALPDPGTAEDARVGVVAREAPDWRRTFGLPEGGARLCVDLSRTSAPLTESVLSVLDVGFFCPSSLFAVSPGCTVIVLSARAIAAARRTHDALGNLAPVVRGLHALTAGEASPGIGDWLMFAHGVRSRLESDLSQLEAAIEQRFRLVAEWATQRPWLVPPRRVVGGDLVAEVSATLPVGLLSEVGTFLEEHHIGYGLVDGDAPDRFRIGLYDVLPLEDLQRTLGLLDFLVRSAL